MTRLILFLIFPLAFFSAETAAQSRFDDWDKDKNGKLTKEELPAGLRRNFDRVDADKDGFISRTEDAAIRKQGSNRQIEGVKKIADLDYSGNGNPRQMLDILLPETPKPADGKPLPLVCWIHGGGWQNGSKNNARFVTDLVKTGQFAGASIGYRLTNEAHWPAQIHDCKAAIRFLKANAEKYGYDADRIAVWGSSAGGHLVAMLGVSHNVKELEGTLGKHGDQSSEVACVVNYFGPADLLKMNDQGSKMDHNAATSPEGKLVGGEVSKTQDIAKSASPITHASRDDEPMLIIHGTKDALVPYQQSVDLEVALEDTGVPVILVTVDEGGHGQGFGPETTKIATQFLRKQLLGEGKLPKDQTIKAVAQKPRR